MNCDIINTKHERGLRVTLDIIASTSLVDQCRDP